MSKNYSIEYINGITRIQFLTKPSFNDAQIAIDDIAENFPYEKRLWDLSNIKFDFTMKDIKAIAEYGKSKFIKPNKLAIIAPDNWAYIELHIFQAHRKQNGHSEAKVVKTEQEALKWLSQ